MKQGTPNAHVVWNVLVDQGGVERLVLCPDAQSGLDLVRTRGHSERQIGTIWCRDDNDGPVQVSLKGMSESSFSWSGPRPQALLSAVRPPLSPFAAAHAARHAR